MDYDFSLFLFTAIIITGIAWGGYCYYLKRIGEEYDLEKEPLLIEYARSFFPVVLFVFILRSFIAEPFRIPSGSMMPTLLIGDFILVNKFAYGVRLPIINKKIIDIGQPERGDVVVFRYPKDPNIDYIKRIIGLPGDKITYLNKKLLINGQSMQQTSLGEFAGVGQGVSMTGAEMLSENLQTVKHQILINHRTAKLKGTYLVPKGHYFVMGDNRDNSNDSRYWGTVPEENLLGKAFFIWMSWDWQYKGVGFERIGIVIQ
jgi:signal peptidase I